MLERGGPISHAAEESSSGYIVRALSLERGREGEGVWCGSGGRDGHLGRLMLFLKTVCAEWVYIYCLRMMMLCQESSRKYESRMHIIACPFAYILACGEHLIYIHVRVGH